MHFQLVMKSMKYRQLMLQNELKQGDQDACVKQLLVYFCDSDRLTENDSAYYIATYQINKYMDMNVIGFDLIILVDCLNASEKYIWGK